MSEQLIQTPSTFGENGNFLLERELGAGGMGGVYMGRDKMLDRPIAVKVMLKELGADAEFVEKFKKEAQSAARLIHPNIAQIYSYGICNGMPYIAMELAAGGSLYTIMNANPGKTDVTRVIKICQQVAQALQCASDQGCVHGDVKPENILLDANGNAKLVDFGLAAMQKDTKEIWGTPYYIAPEKVKKEPIDFRADMYSLGGTLYHALTGVAPFEGKDPVAVVKKRFEGSPKKPSTVRHDLTPAIDNLVLKMLALDPAKRYPSLEALIKAFNDVLTSGLTAKSAPAKAKKTVGLVRPSGLHSGRRLTPLKRPANAVAPKITGKVAMPPPTIAEDEEEKEGNLGLKVVGSVFGGIALILAVVGGLIWYQVADRKAREADELAQITDGINRARESISMTVDAARKFADEFDTFSAKAATECQKSTDRLKDCLPAEDVAQLKPALSKELLDAIASTNELAKASTETNAAQVAEAKTNAVATTVATETKTAPVVAAVALPKFRPPTEDEMDPASPEGEAYLKERAAFYEEQKKQMTAAVRMPSPVEEPQPASTGSEKKPALVTDAIIAMNELWNRVYSCQACAIRIRLETMKIIRKGEESDAIKGVSRPVMEQLAEQARIMVEDFEKIKLSKDVENVKKGISFIKSKGAKTVEQTVNRLRIEKLERERKEKAEEAAKAEEERLKRLAAEKKAKIEAECAEAKSMFDAIVMRGDLRQLDWSKALRSLNALKEASTTVEGQLACDFEIRKVNDMKSVQDIFIANIKGHTFKGKLSKCKVIDVNENEIVLLKPDGKSKPKILWQTFYKDYPGNLNELINVYIGVKRDAPSKVKLKLRDWADAAVGAALTMKLVCSEVMGAVEKSEMLAKEVVKCYPDYLKIVQGAFPDVNFDDIKED